MIQGKFAETIKSNKVKLRNIIIIALTVFLVIGCAMFALNEVIIQKKRAKKLETHLKLMASSVRNMDADQAQTELDRIKLDSAEIRASLQEPFWRFAAKVPMASNEFHSVNVLLDNLDKASEDILQPGVTILKGNPLGNIKQDGQYNSELLIHYLELGEQVLPEIKEMVSELNALKLGLLDRNGRIAGMLALADTALNSIEIGPEQIQGAIGVLSEHPLEGLKTEKGIDSEGINQYLKYAESLLPEVKKTIANVQAADIDVVRNNEKLNALVSTADCLLNENHQVEDLFHSFVAVVEKNPVGELKKNGGFNVVQINQYLDYVDANVNEIEQAVQIVQEKKLGEKLANEKINGMINTGTSLLKLYKDEAELVDFARKILGDGSDKTYLLMAMNSAEIRACGGFPGSAGTIQVRNGILKIGDFKSIYSMMPFTVAPDAKVTPLEGQLFVGRMARTWDASFCPDFERIGKMWGHAYAQKINRPVDGVIGMTPAIIQKLVNIVGDVKLSDGTVLTGTNTTRILQHDIYFQHFTTDKLNMGAENWAVDKLFSETAKIVIQRALSDMKAHYIPEYVNVIKESCADRTIVMWMENEEEQAIVKKFGWSGGLNDDEQNPAAGIYMNGTLSSKMGWFVELDPEIGTPTVNSDGSRTYPIKITISNIMTEEEIKVANRYIHGGGKGDFQGSLYLFAPAGGTVEDFVIGNNSKVVMYEYAGLQLGHVPFIWVKMNEDPLVVTYNVTTAPGVDTPLVISQTPTLQAYH